MTQGWTGLVQKSIVTPEGEELPYRGKVRFELSDAITELEVVDDSTNEESVIRIPRGGTGQSIIKEPVRLAFTDFLPSYTRVGNVITFDADGVLQVDGEDVVADDRVLLPLGADPEDAGIYLVSYAGDVSNPAVLVRAIDADDSDEFSSGMRVPVLEGDTNAGLIFELATDADPIVLNATALEFIVQRIALGGALVAELRAQIASTAVGGKLFLRGYSTPNDGGEGTFTVVAGGSYTDNGGTTFVAGGFGATESKAAVRDYFGAIDARWFNDGVLSASQVLARAIAALPTEGGTVDATNLVGTRVINSDFFAGVTKKGTLLLGQTIFQCSTAVNVPSHWTIKGQYGGRPLNAFWTEPAGGDRGTVFRWVGATGATRTAARVATTAALPAYTRVGNVITANSNTAVPTTAADGVTLATNDRVLLVTGAAGADNGIYVVTQTGSGAAPFILTRATDADISAEFTADFRVPITAGTAYAGKTFVFNTRGTITLNTTALDFVIGDAILRFTDVEFSTLTDVVLDGDEIAGIQGIVLDSKSLSLSLHNVNLTHIAIYNCAVGIQWGNDEPPTLNNSFQIDKVLLQQFHIGSIISGAKGIVISSGNAASDSKIEIGAVQCCHTGIDIKLHAYLAIKLVSFGSLGNSPAPLQNDPIAIKVAVCTPLLIEQCQSENSYAGGGSSPRFFKAVSNTYGRSNAPVILKNNVINVNEALEIAHPISVVSIGNFGPTAASAPGIIGDQATDLVSLGDTFNNGTGWGTSGSNMLVKKLTGKGFAGSSGLPGTLPNLAPFRIDVGSVITLTAGVDAGNNRPWIQGQHSSTGSTFYGICFSPMGGGVSIGAAGSTTTGNLAFAKTITAGKVLQDPQTTDTACFNLELRGQDAYASATGSNRNGGSLVLAGGELATGGQAGAVLIRAGAQSLARFQGFSSSNTFAFEPTRDPYITFDQNTGDVASKTLTILGQSATTASTGTNRNGGNVVVRGGAKNTGGVDGSAILADYAGNKVVEAAEGSKLGLYGATPIAQPARVGALTGSASGTTDGAIEALPNPADTPATADALRDDLVANLIPALRNNIDELRAKINALEAKLSQAGGGVGVTA